MQINGRGTILRPIHCRYHLSFKQMRKPRLTPFRRRAIGIGGLKRLGVGLDWEIPRFSESSK